MSGVSGAQLNQEERELRGKRERLLFVRSRLIQRQRVLECLRSELAAFEELYEELIGSRFAELDELRERLAALRPQSRTPAPAAASGTEQPCGPTGDWRLAAGLDEFDESEVDIYEGVSLRDLYRKVAKLIHPDLAASDGERQHRQKLMAEVNHAYGAGDREFFLEVLREWEASADILAGGDGGAELISLIREIAVVEGDVELVEAEIARVRGSQLFRLLLQVEEAWDYGTDLLGEMAATLDDEILRARDELGELTGGGDALKPTEAEAGRMVSFPADSSSGELYVRSSSSRSYRDWRKVGAARGDVSLPPGLSVRLDLSSSAPLSAGLLSALGPDDLQALFIHDADDAGLALVSRLTGLEKLYLAGGGVSNLGLIHLTRLEKLKKLYLYDTSVSDGGAVSLKRLTSLESLTLSNTRISDKELQSLRQALPACSIVTLSYAVDRAAC